MNKRELRDILIKQGIQCKSVGQIAAILSAATMPDTDEITNEQAEFIASVLHFMNKKGMSLPQAVEYVLSGKGDEFSAEDQLAEAVASGQNQIDTALADILHGQVHGKAIQYQQTFFPLFAAAVNSEAVNSSPEVLASIKLAEELLCGRKGGNSSFFTMAVVGAARKNLLPSSQPQTGLSLVGVSEA